MPADDGRDDGIPGVDRLKAELVRREVARQIDQKSRYATDVSQAWRRWARATLTPKVDYMATIRHAVRRALRDSTLGRYDRTYRQPHRRQAAYGEFIMASFYQPRPRPGFLIDTSSSMEDSQLDRAVAELGGLTRQLGYGADVVVACCDAAVHNVRKVFSATQVELYGGGGTDIGVGIRAFIDRKFDPIDLLVIVTDCRTPWPAKTPPFPVITIRVGDGAPPPWGNYGANRVITIEDADAIPARTQMRKASVRNGPLGVAGNEPVETSAADDSAGLSARLDAARGVGILDGHAPRRRLDLWHRVIRQCAAGIVTVFDFTNCYAAPPIVQPCERVAYRAGDDEPRVQRVVWTANDCRRAVAPLGVVDCGRAQTDHR